MSPRDYYVTRGQAVLLWLLAGGAEMTPGDLAKCSAGTLTATGVRCLLFHLRRGGYVTVRRASRPGARQYVRLYTITPPGHVALRAWQAANPRG